MNALRPGWRFLVRFAWRDIADRRTRNSTLVLVGSIALVTALTLVSLAIPRAAELAQQQSLARQPGATGLNAWNPGGPLSEQLSEPGLRDLREAIARRTADRPDALTAFAPYRTILYSFLEAGEREVWTRIPGRTIRLPDDPLLSTWGLPPEQTFADSSDTGIVVTPRFLSRLNLPADLAPGSTVRLLTRAGSTIEVVVRGRLPANLPSGYTFVLTEAGRDDLETREPDIVLKSVVSGPLPAGWPGKPRNLSPVAQTRVQELCTYYRVGFPQSHEDWTSGRPVDVWKFDALSGNTEPRRSEWHNLLSNLHDRLGEIGMSASPGPKTDPEFARVPLPKSVRRESVAATNPDMVGIYMNRLDDLEPAARAVEESGYQCDDGIIRQIRAYAESAAIAGEIMLWVLAVVWVAALVNLGSLQGLRLQQKQAEVGMLRAMGAGNRTLNTIGSMQAFLLWLGGSLVGCATVALAVRVAMPALMPGTAFGDVFTRSWATWAVGFLGFSLAGCVLSTWIGGLGARRLSPAEALTKM